MKMRIESTNPASVQPRARTDVWEDAGLAVLRVVLGLILVVHGAQKLFGFGFAGVAGMLDGLGVPASELLAPMVVLVELAGGIALVVGVFTRIAAALIAVDMLVATLLLHLPNGFFVANGGVEFTLMLLAAAVEVALTGPGVFSVDHLLWGRDQSPGPRSPAVA